MDTKICKICLQEQPITQFRNGPLKKSGKRYRYHECNTCREIARRQKTAEARAIRLANKPTEKCCVQCRQTQALSEFPKGHACSTCNNKNRRERAAFLRATDPTFKAWEEEKKRLWKQWAKEHPAEFKAAKQRWDAANKEKIRANHRTWKATHKRPPRTPREIIGQSAYHRVHMLDPEYRRTRNQKTREWAKANPAIVQEQSARRRARLKGAPRVEKIDRAAIIARDRSICHLCGLVVPPEEMSLDHLIPLARGGSHTADNLAVAHLTCNKRRGTKPLAS